MNIIVCDDEPLARERLKKICLTHKQIEQVFVAQNANQLFELCNFHSVDLVLLDIRMPGLSGIEAASELKQTHSNISVIFTTAYDEYAIKAFKVDAADYLLKPIKQDELFNAIDKVFASKQKLGLVATNNNTEDDHLVLKVRMGPQQLLIKCSEILYLQTEDKLAKIFTKEGSYYLDCGLKELHPDLIEQFIRVHRSTLVNKKHLKGIVTEPNSQYILLHNSDIKVPASRRMAVEVKHFMDEQTQFKPDS